MIRVIRGFNDMQENLKPVALVSMPTLSARFPSFQLALLKPTLEKAGIPVQTFSLFMYFGTFVGWRINETLADVYPSMVGEWLWTKSAFGDFANNDEYFEIYRRNLEGICYKAGCSLDDLKDLRDKAAPAFIDWCVKSVDWSRFRVIGFSVVFQQTLASIALAAALKKRYPHIPIMMGGATFEDDIAEEIMKGCPQVDYIHCGDADETLPKAIRRVYSGESMKGMPGVMWRDNGRVVYNGRAPNLSDMNKTPTPDFDEYFYARKQGGYEYDDEAHGVLLPIETARGCWWGVKNHCTFCGLNRAGMEFRSKRVENVIEQLDELSRRYAFSISTRSTTSSSLNTSTSCLASSAKPIQTSVCTTKCDQACRACNSNTCARVDCFQFSRESRVFRRTFSS